jgi:hypothetical protein
MDLSNVQLVALIGFVSAVVFGAIANKTSFCAMGAVSDWVHMGDKNRLRAWSLAMGVAVLGSQILQAATSIELNDSIYLTANFNWLGHVLGGLLFGIGMTLGSGCGQRTLVRVGNGNLKSLVVLLVLAVVAYMTLRGLIAPFRIGVIEAVNVDLARYGLDDQGITGMVALAAGIEPSSNVRWTVIGVVGVGLIVFALASRSFRQSFDNMLAGFSVGAIVVSGWYVTGIAGFDDFEPVRLQSYSFVAPVAENLLYLMTYTGSTIGFAVASVFGIATGSFLYAVATKGFRIETFTSRNDMIAHLAGGALMGFGGVIALGCTVGQGLTGLSTLALGSVITLACIVFSSALTMKVEYYLLDERGFGYALRMALADLYLFPGPARVKDPPA